MKKLLILLGMIIFMFGCTGFGVDIRDTGKKDSIVYTTGEYTLEGSDITILFTKDSVSGFSGVNRYFGSLEIHGDEIKIGHLASTLMMGDEKKMEIEGQYLKKLSQVNRIIISGDTVTLTDGENVLRFKKSV